MDASTLERRLFEATGYTEEGLQHALEIEDPFIMLAYEQKYAELCAEFRGDNKVDDLSRGSPSWIHSGHSEDSMYTFTYAGNVAVKIANLYREGITTFWEDIKNAKDAIRVKEILRNAALNIEVAGVKLYNATAVDILSDRLHDVICELARVSGASDESKEPGKITPRESMKIALYKDMLQNIGGNPYGDKTGLLINKVYFKGKLEGAGIGLDARVIEEGEHYPHNDLLITQGVSQAIDVFFRTDHFQAGDYVVVLTPFYTPYQLLTASKHLKIIPVACDDHGRIYMDGLDKLINLVKIMPEEERLKIKAIPLIDPSNPTGALLNIDEKKKIKELARLCPNAIVFEDVVYHEFTPEFKFMHEIDPEHDDVPTIVSTSVSKFNAFAGLRDGVVYLNSLVQDLWKSMKILDRVPVEQKTALNLFAYTKGGPASHTNQVASPAQIQAAICGTYDEMHGYKNKLLERLDRTTKRLLKTFHIEEEERDGNCQYYFWLNVGSFAETLVVDEENSVQTYVKDNLNVPKILIDAIKRYSIVLFNGRSFFPKSAMPQWFVENGYADIYLDKQNGKPKSYLRGALPNTNEETCVAAYQKVAGIITEQVSSLVADYKRNNRVETPCLVPSPVM